MKLPPFSDFVKGIDQAKLTYDLKNIASLEFLNSSNPFTQEQYTLLIQTIAVMNITLLQQYHEWLNQQLSP